MMLKTMLDGYQTSFNIIQQHATSSNMVAKRVQHVGFNNVGWCCINMLDPFGRAMHDYVTRSNLTTKPRLREIFSSILHLRVVFTRIFFSSLLLWEFVQNKICNFKEGLVVKFARQMSSYRKGYCSWRITMDEWFSFALEKQRTELSLH